MVITNIDNFTTMLLIKIPAYWWTFISGKTNHISPSSLIDIRKFVFKAVLIIIYLCEGERNWNTTQRFNFKSTCWINNWNSRIIENYWSRDSVAFYKSQMTILTIQIHWWIFSLMKNRFQLLDVCLEITPLTDFKMILSVFGWSNR